MKQQQAAAQLDDKQRQQQQQPGESEPGTSGMERTPSGSFTAVQLLDSKSLLTLRQSSQALPTAVMLAAAAAAGHPGAGAMLAAPRPGPGPDPPRPPRLAAAQQPPKQAPGAATAAPAARRSAQAQPAAPVPKRLCSVPAPSAGPEATKQLLGERNFYIARAIILRQQEVFQQQLFEVHRLARVQAQLTAELSAPHAEETARHAAEAEALLAARRAGAAVPAGTRLEAARPRARERPTLPPGGERPISGDDRGAKAVGALPLHVSMMLNIPSCLRKGISMRPPAASAPAAAADHFWAARKTAGLHRPLASRYPSGATGGCLPALSGDTTVAQPQDGGGLAANAVPPAAAAAPAASAGRAHVSGRPVAAPAATHSAPADLLKAAAGLKATGSVGAWQQQQQLKQQQQQHQQLRSSQLRRQQSGGTSALRPLQPAPPPPPPAGAPARSGGPAGTATTSGSGGVIKPRALPAAVRPPVLLSGLAIGPKSPDAAARPISWPTPSGRSSQETAATPSRGAAAGGPPPTPPKARAPLPSAPAASAPLLGPLGAPLSAAAAPRPFASLQLPAASGQLSGASLSAPSINPFRPVPQLQPLLASQLLAGGAASPLGALQLAPQPFDPHSYWMQKHFGAGGTAAAAAGTAASPLSAPRPASAAPPPLPKPAALPSPPSGARPGPAAAALAAAASPQRPAPKAAVVHWWQDAKAVFGDGPGLIDPDALCGGGVAAAPPPLTQTIPLPRRKRPLGATSGGGGGGGGADSDSSCHESRGGSLRPPQLAALPPAAGRMAPPDGAPASAAAAGAVRGSAFRAVERRALPKQRGSRVLSSRPSVVESVDSDGHGGGVSAAAAPLRKRHRAGGHGGRGAAGEDSSQRTDGSAFASAAAGILLSLSSGG